MVSLAVAGVSEDQPRLIEAEATHHAAGGVGEEGGYILAVVGTGEGDLVFRDFGLQLALQAVSSDEEPVVLCL